MQNSGHLNKSDPGQFTCENQRLEDAIVSLSHRMALLETGLSSKIDRDECMRISENKASTAQLNKLSQELSQALTQQLNKNQQRTRQQSQAAFRKFASKLGTKPQKNLRKKQPVKIVPPQDLYLESDETMFSLIIDEISALKNEQERVQRLVAHKKQTTLNLHNEVCHKIDKLEQELELRQSVPYRSCDKEPGEFSLHQGRHGEMKGGHPPRPSEQQFNAKTVHRIETHNAPASSIEMVRLDNLARSVEALQSEMTVKINIRDVLPLVQSNVEHVIGSVQEIKSYTEAAVDSTKKILIHQSEINQQLCLLSRAAWWQSFESAQGLAIWNKQVINMIPEILEFDSHSNEIRIIHQGTFMLKLLSKDSQYPESIMIGSQQHELHGNELLVTVSEKNSLVRIFSEGSQFLMIIQKI